MDHVIHLSNNFQMLSPIMKYGEIFNLTNFGIDSKFLKANSTQMESEKYILVREVDAQNVPQISVVDVQSGNVIYKKALPKAEGAIMHPSEFIMALKAPNENGKGHILQIVKPEAKQKLKTIEFSQNIVFWKWVNPTKLAVVTNSSVYHVSIADKNNEVKVFDRAGGLVDSQFTQIIGYALEPNEKWAALYGMNTPDGGKTINGHIQLYFIEGGKQQLLQGYACTFGKAYIHNDSFQSTLFCFVQKKINENVAKVHINQISAAPEGYTKHKKNTQIKFDAAPADFPISLILSEKYGLLYIITKSAFVYIYELISCEQIFKAKLKDDSVFLVAKNTINDGLLAITKGGSLMGGIIDEQSLIPTIMNSNIANSKNLAFEIAGRYKLPGLDNIFLEQFNMALLSGDYAGAARIASKSPGALIRNQDTINKFKQLPQIPGQPQPLLIYFQTLLEKGKLNKLQTMELCVPVITQGKTDLVSGWLNSGKLDLSQELGTLLERADKNLALKVYTEGGFKQKIVEMQMQLGNIEQAMKTAQESGIQMDISSTLKNMVDTNPEGALKLAKSLYEKNPNIDIRQIADLFIQKNRVQQFTTLLFDCMRKNLPEDAPYQTKVLELNLMSAPQVVDTILKLKIWNQFNKQKIASLCEQKGLYQRALQNYTDPKDIKRVLLNTHVLSPEYVGEFLNTMAPDVALSCMADMIKYNRNNLQIVISSCVANIQKLGVSNIIKMFESVGSYEGIYYFLGSILNNTNDHQIYYKYIQAAAKVGQLEALQNVIKNKSDCYDPIKVKDLLIDLKLQDPKPIIFLCDAHNQIQDLTKYLYKNNFQKFIEVYLFRVSKNPQAPAIVLGTLIDLQCEETYIKQLLKTIRAQCPVEQVVDQFEKRNKLRVLESWLQDRVSEGIQIPALHNALAKNKIDTNQNPQQFLQSNQFYDPKIVGKFCEDRDPHLAVIAYKRSPGLCDQELISCTNKNGLYRIQAQYLVNRQSKDLWKLVLSVDNPYRKQIIDQVVSSALPESKNPDEVITAVQAFMEAELTFELMSLLEKIVLHNSEFAQYKKLQNLLIITAIKCDKARVMDYINRLDNYDGPQIAKIAMGEQYKLYEEAFVIYKKKGMNLDSIEVLLDYIQDLDRARDFAEKVNQADVWSKLGNAYLDKFLTNEAIDCYLRSKDSTQFLRVIHIVDNESEDAEGNSAKYENLLKYLNMAREATRDPAIDNAYTYALARLNKIPELEAFLSNTNSADCQKVGDKCFKLKMYEAAKVLYTVVKNNSKISSCLVHMKEFNAAIAAAQKANTPKTWKELCMACVEAKQYKLASQAGMQIIIHPDELEDLIVHYESHGVTEEMISLLETGVGLQRAHVGIFTELAILYAKYHPEKLMDHCKNYMSKLNTTKVLRACEKFMLWNQAVYLYSQYNEYDNAINIMIEHSPYAFDHDVYMQTIQKVPNTDLYYKSIVFYLEEQPLQLNDLLKCLSNKIDYVKCVSVMRRLGFVALITPFLKSVQASNTKQVNQALNQIYLENEDYEALRQSITTYQSFDAYALAKQIENHELLEFRRIAALLFRRTGKFEQSINLSKNDEMYRDAIETAQESGKSELAEDLLRFFVQKGQKQYFTVTLYTCYELLKPDVVLQYAWRYGLYDFCMPYIIQLVKELNSTVGNVQQRIQTREQKEEKEAQQQMNQPLGDFGYNNMMPGLGAPMLMGPDMGMNTMGSMGGSMGSTMGGPSMMNSMGGGFGSQFGTPNPNLGGFY